MKKDIYVEFFKNILQSQKVQNDDFFPDEAIKKASEFTFSNYNSFNRIIGEDEKTVIEKEAFELLLFWLKNGFIEIEFFERFLSVLVAHEGRLKRKVDADIILSMIEMISVTDFQEHVIYTTINIFIETPEVFGKEINTIH